MHDKFVEQSIETFVNYTSQEIEESNVSMIESAILALDNLACKKYFLLLTR